MKNVKIVNQLRCKLWLLWPSNSLAVMPWLEQMGAWIISLNVDWTKLPWAVGASIVSMLKARKDDQGNIIHKSFSEWLLYAGSCTFLAMAAWKDVQKKTDLSGELSVVIAALIAWIVADIIIKSAKKQLNNSDQTPKP